jgi:type II secretory pathway component GspD/PulD (secretin)
MTPMRQILLVSRTLTAVALALTLAASAQTPAPAPGRPGPSAEPTPASASSQSALVGPVSLHFFHLVHTTTQQEANEIFNAIRNLNDPHIRIFLNSSQNVIAMESTADQIALAQKIVNELDVSHKTYRITYTLIDLDGTKRVGDQHYAMVLAPGQRTVLKQGNKIPVVTGAYLKEINAPQTQVTYLDIGMSFDATLDEAPNSLRLKTKVDQSSVVEDRSGTVAQDPIVRQSVFEGSAILIPGKPLIIGSLDIAGTTRRIEIQVTVEPIP